MGGGFGVYVPVSKLLLQGIQTTTAVEEVDGVPMSEQVGMHISLKPCPTGELPDYLVSPLLGEVSAFARRKQEVIPLNIPVLRIEQDVRHQPLLDEYHSFDMTFTKDSYAIPAHICEPDPDGLTDTCTGLPQQPKE